MATLEDLGKKSISEMSSEELQGILIGIRRNRRTPPPAPKKKEAKPKPAQEITSADAAALLKLLGVTDD